MIKEDLQKAGLNATEAEIYLTLYEYRRLSPVALSELTGIKRTTVYAAADELVKKGLVNLEHGKNKRFYIVDSTKNLERYIKKEEQKILSRKKAVEKAIQSLEKIPRALPVITPKIRVITHDNITDFLYKQTPVWEKNMKKVGTYTWWGFQDHAFVENESYREWIYWYWKRAQRKMNLKLFTNASSIEEDKKLKRIKRRVLREWTGELPITGTQWILGDYIISLVIDGKHNYLIQMHDAIMAHNLRELYKKLWEDVQRSNKNSQTSKKK